MKPERYKVKSISEIAENSAIISGLNQGQDMDKFEKAYNDEQIYNIINYIKNKKGTDRPNGISLGEIINRLKEYDINNLLKHLSLNKDSKNRLENLSLIEPTLKDYDLKIKVFEPKQKEIRYKLIKKFKGIFALISLSENEKIFYTFIPTIEYRQLKKELEKAIK